MAIKNLFARGIGFTGGQIGWVVTRGYGSITADGGTGDDVATGYPGRFGRLGRRRKLLFALLPFLLLWRW